MFKKGESVKYNGEIFVVIESIFDHLFLVVEYIIKKGDKEIIVDSHDLVPNG